MDDQNPSTYVVNIHLTRGLVVILTLLLLVVGFLAYLGLSERAVSAAVEPSIQSAAFSMRKYYLSSSGHRGDQALNACAAGYHMASLWEIQDPSNMEYNTSLGETTSDSGQGPPSWPFWGWVRTGYSNDNSITPGRANCNGWSTITGKGTYAALTDSWTAGLADVHVWDVDTGGGTWDCSANFRVWCVED